MCCQRKSRLLLVAVLALNATCAKLAVAQSQPGQIATYWKLSAGYNADSIWEVFSSDGRYFAGRLEVLDQGQQYFPFCVFDSFTGRVRYELYNGRSGRNAGNTAFISGNTLLALVACDSKTPAKPDYYETRRLEIWDVVTGKKVRETAELPNWDWALIPSPDGKHLIACCWGKYVHYRVDTLEAVSSGDLWDSGSPHGPTTGRFVTFSPSGDLFSVRSKTSLELRRSDNGKLVTNWKNAVGPFFVGQTAFAIECGAIYPEGWKEGDPPPRECAVDLYDMEHKIVNRRTVDISAIDEHTRLIKGGTQLRSLRIEQNLEPPLELENYLCLTRFPELTVTKRVQLSKKKLSIKPFPDERTYAISESPGDWTEAADFYLWDSETEREISGSRREQQGAGDFFVSPDGKRMISNGLTADILWDVDVLRGGK